MLQRADIFRAFDALATELERRGITGRLFVVGGGAMAIAYSDIRVTADLDGVYEPKAEVARAAAAVAEGLGLDDHWLNDAVKAYLPGADPEATVCYRRPGLTVDVASPRYLFVLKAAAARDVDIDDLRILYRLAGFSSSAEALDAVTSAIPPQRLRPIVRFMVEGVAAEIEGRSTD